MIDFSKCIIRKKAYGGANGNKICIVYNNQIYMLKLPTHSLKNINLSYSNSAISEHIGCFVFKTLNIDSQETILGKYNFHGNDRIVVACKDFVGDNEQLLDFASVKNQIIDSTSNGYGTELSDILETIEKQNVIEKHILMERFWEMFIVDALIGNWDRHNGNWGFIYNSKNDSVKLAPVFDCGSSFFPQIDQDTIDKVLSNKKEQMLRVYSFPTSAILQNGGRINYYEFLSKHQYKECDDALRKIALQIDLQKIYDFINSIDVLCEKHKAFLCLMIELRYKCILLKNIIN